ncbi:MAG: hypothetical protein Q9167_005283 [Letrouitia subvulpina]
MDHAKCSKIKCFASQIDNDTYVTKHIDSNCRCNHVTIDSEVVKTILQSGKIPRFLFRPRGHQMDFEIALVDFGPYVAISHVWAHGLGNAQANSLPLCQIQRLYNYVSSLETKLKEDRALEPFALWIDTLGVPLEREGRKLALKSLQRTYMESACCLILDEELYSTSRDCSPEEIWLRLAIFAWSRRLWTFQEGFVTGDKLYIQFSDGPIDVKGLRKLVKPSLCSPLFTECIEDAKRHLPRERDVASSEQTLIGSITEACRYRTTSRISDECFCLASIARLDVQDIVQAATHEEKMRLFLLHLQELPKAIIFHIGPRLMVKNFHWAPLTFLYPEPSSNIFGSTDDEDAVAQCLSSGLQAKWPGFFLNFPPGAGPRSIYYFKFKEFNVVVHPNSLMKQKLWGAAADEEQISTWQQIYELKRPGLLIESLDILQNVGLMVSVESSGPEAVTAQSFLRVSATIVPVDMPDLFNPERVDSVKAMEISGELVGDKTVWTLV